MVTWIMKGFSDFGVVKGETLMRLLYTPMTCLQSLMWKGIN